MNFTDCEIVPVSTKLFSVISQKKIMGKAIFISPDINTHDMMANRTYVQLKNLALDRTRWNQKWRESLS